MVPRANGRRVSTPADIPSDGGATVGTPAARPQFRCRARLDGPERRRPRHRVPRRRTTRPRRRSPSSCSCCSSVAGCGWRPADGAPRCAPPSTPAPCSGWSAASRSSRCCGSWSSSPATGCCCRPGSVAPGRCSARSSSSCWSPLIAAPAVLAGRLAATQRDLIAGVFDDNGKSATVTAGAEPVRHQERVNVLLLGGDGGAGREGVRTDTVIVASIDTRTGDTTLFSLPRNLENLPFPPAARWPRRSRTASRPRTRARACSTRSTATARPSTPTSSAPPTTRAPTG